MNSRVLKELENYIHNHDELHEAPGDYAKEMGISPQEHTLPILEYLFRNRNHPSAEEIFHNLQPTTPGLTRAAVNNTLEALSQIGAIQIVYIDRHDTSFDGDTTPHAHLICTCCGEIEDIPLASNISRNLMLPKGSVVDDIQLMCLGMCAKCNSKSNRDIN